MEDQGHHFAPFFQWGVSLGSAYKEDPLGVMVTVTIGSAVGEMIQKYFGLGSPSVADFRLGASAAILGAAFGLGTIAPQELGSRIKSEFCNH